MLLRTIEIYQNRKIRISLINLIIRISDDIQDKVILHPKNI